MNKPIKISLTISGETTTYNVGEYLVSLFETLARNEEDDDFEKEDVEKLKNFREFFAEYINSINNTDSSKLIKLVK